MPKFSIIIPVYNVAPYLRECLDSVVAQTFADWEAICVDDGSTDGSGAILDEYRGKVEKVGGGGRRMVVIHQANAGVSAARNAALDVAQGEWILFLDADDVFELRALSGIVETIGSLPDAKLVRFDYRQFGAFELRAVDDEEDCVPARRDISKVVSMQDFCVYAWQFAYLREAISGVRFKRYRRGEDRVFVDAILLKCVNSFVDIKRRLYGYRLRVGSAMNSIPTAQVLVDEMQHRRDLVLMIEASKKIVPYAGSGWLEGYFTDSVGSLIALKAPQERRILWREWYVCVRDMQGAVGLSRRTRLMFGVFCADLGVKSWLYFCASAGLFGTGLQRVCSADF